MLDYLHSCINTTELYHAITPPEADCKIAQLLQGCTQDLTREALKPRVDHIMPHSMEASSFTEAEGELETLCRKGSCGMESTLCSTSQPWSHNIYNPVPSPEWRQLGHPVEIWFNVTSGAHFKHLLNTEYGHFETMSCPQFFLLLSYHSSACTKNIIASDGQICRIAVTNYKNHHKWWQNYKMWPQ